MSRAVQADKKKLDALLAGAPGLSVAAAPNDMTRHLLGKLDVRPDSRGGAAGYTPSDVRSRLKIDIKKTHAYHDKLERILPSEAMGLVAGAKKATNAFARLSTRGPGDGFRSGADFTLTRIDGVARGGDRVPADTPQPRSPRPETHGQSLVADSRYERSHQNPYQYTGVAGNTVWAPTQANQVVDTHMERFVAGSRDAYLFRHDTFTHSTLTAVRAKGAGYESQQASYQRRPIAAAVATATAAPPAAAAAADPPSKRKHSVSSPPTAAASSSAAAATHAAPAAAAAPTYDVNKRHRK